MIDYSAKGFVGFTEAERDARHEMVVSRFPGGLTVAQFEMLTLESARGSDGLCDPPSVDYLTGMSILMRMLMNGLVEHRGGYHAPMRFFITDKGKTALANAAKDFP